MGNVASDAVNSYQFALDLALPGVISIEIGGKSGDVVFINGNEARIVAVLSAAPGSVLTEGGSSLVVKDASGGIVVGELHWEGANALIWEPLSLPTDGSVDGRYTVEITPVDTSGRRGEVVVRAFIYDTEVPRITAASPLILSQPISYLNGDLQQFSFTVEDVGPADLAWVSQSVVLLDAAGSAVPTTLTYDELSSQLYLTLASPLAQDGSADGEYTVKLDIVDKAGNVLASEHSLFYDSQVPSVSSVIANTVSPVSLVAGGIVDISGSLSSLTLEFEESTRVDFTNTTIALVGPDEAAIPLTLEANGRTGLTARFLALREVGVYTLSVTAQDIVGNVASDAVNSYQFALDLALPGVVSVEIGGKSGDVVFINGNEARIAAVLSDTMGRGLTEGGSSLIVKDASGGIVVGELHWEGANALIWEPLSLPTDGSVDGRYTVEITPVDTSGRRGEVVVRAFIYDTEVPRITAASPLILSQPISYLNGDLQQFSFTVEDVGPSDLAWVSQSVVLLDAAGSVVPTTLTYNDLSGELYLTLSSPFAQDGSADGAYTVALGIVDKAGNLLTSDHAFVYDSQVPRLSSVQVNTESPVSLVAGDIVDISGSLSSLTVEFEEATRVDFTNTAITLMGPGEVAIPLTLEPNGRTGLTARFLPLREVGVYTLSVTAQDIVGNVASGAVSSYQFALDLALPGVVSVEIGGKSGDVVFINGSEARIVAVLSAAPGSGLTEGGSSLVVKDASGGIVAGELRWEGDNALVWEPLSLPADGSVDGRYTVEITPVDTSGRQGEVVTRAFIYDTELPRITGASPLMLNQPISYLNGDLQQFTFTVEDVGPSDLAWVSQSVVLLDASGSAVPTTLTYDDLSGELYLTLSSPFAQDGSADGAYTVALGIVDKAGNLLTSDHAFVYDSQVPSVSSVLVNIDPPTELVPNRIAEILEPLSNITLTFEEATRVDFANTEVTLIGPALTGSSDESTVPSVSLTLEDDGVSQMTIRFLNLEQIGSYTLSVKPQDVAGNTASGAVDYTFILDIPLPQVGSVVIGESETIGSGDVAYVNASNMLIGAVLLDPTETGLSFGSDGSSITVTEADGTTVVPGATGSNGTDLIVWEPRTLTADGTTDGRYSVYVIPVDKAGRQGSTVYREFVYDTQEPEITGCCSRRLKSTRFLYQSESNAIQFHCRRCWPCRPPAIRSKS